MDIQKAIGVLESSIPNASEGLPEEVFLFATRITPMVNVDLLIKNEQNQTLLTWRDDGYCTPGWHVPGGIIRCKETIAERLKNVAEAELGAAIEIGAKPLAMHEIIHKSRKNRGHFISLLYPCKLLGPPDERLRCEGTPRVNQWKWHSSCPDDMLSTHEIYREFI